MCYSREPLGVSSYSGASSAWGNVQPESEIMKMLIAMNWKPEVLGEQPKEPQDYFKQINSIIVNINTV